MFYELAVGILVAIVLTGGVAFYGLYEHSRAVLRKKSEEIRTLRQSTSTLDSSKSKDMNGIFEIHITINPKNNYVKLLDFIQVNKSKRNFKLVYAVSSAKNNQYMLSYFTRKTDDKLAVESAQEIATELQRENIEVVRVKVEGHDAKPFPLTDRDYLDMVHYLRMKYPGKGSKHNHYSSSKPYFEFHCKVNKPDLDLEDLERYVSSYKGCGVSYNLCSANKNPLLTIRVYDLGFTTASEYKDTVMNDLKSRGYIFEDKIQQEFAVFDSNPDIDIGFL